MMSVKNGPKSITLLQTNMIERVYSTEHPSVTFSLVSNCAEAEAEAHITLMNSPNVPISDFYFLYSI